MFSAYTIAIICSLKRSTKRSEITLSKLPDISPLELYVTIAECFKIDQSSDCAYAHRQAKNTQKTVRFDVKWQKTTNVHINVCLGTYDKNSDLTSQRFV